MALRPLFAPLRPDLDAFLFAVVGGERNGIPLSTISALTQLDLDPWDEAGRLADLAKGDVVEQLTGLLLRFPGPQQFGGARPRSQGFGARSACSLCQDASARSLT